MSFRFSIIPLTTRSIDSKIENVLEKLRKLYGEKVHEPISKFSELKLEEKPNLIILIFLSGGTSRTAIQIDQVYRCPKVILSMPKDNSLPSALGFLERKKTDSKILHMYYADIDEDVIKDVELVVKSCKAAYRMYRARIGIIGEENLRDEWYDIIKNTDIIPIMVSKLEISTESYEKFIEDLYTYIRDVVDRYNLDGVTLDCFKLLRSIKYTPCLAYAKLLSEKIPISCECDIASLLSMILIKNIDEKLITRSIMANLVDVEGSILRFAHCTGSLSMFEKYELKPHFETGYKYGVEGYVQTGTRCTIFRIDSRFRTSFIAYGVVEENVDKLRDFKACLTKIGINCGMYIDMRDISGNHHIIILENLVEELRIACWYLGLETVMIGSLPER